MPAPRPTSAASWGWRLLGCGIALAAFANAAAYIAYASNPLVASDGWYFIDAFLAKALESGVDLQDYFVKRDQFDHAQPVGKLLLLLNARWFGLDFVYESFVGLALAAAMFACCILATRGMGATRQGNSLRMLGVGALAASLVTLNCGMVFNWSLVTLTYLPYLMATLGALAAWHAFHRDRRVGLVVMSLAIAFAIDDVGLIINAAVAATCLLAGIRLRRLRAGATLAALVIASELAYLAFNHAFLEQQQGQGGDGLATSLASLWARVGELPVLLRVVFGSMLAHINPLVHYFAGNAANVQWVLALVMLAAHGWFWWRAIRGEWNAMVFLAVTLMLVLYGFICGIVYARVPEYGMNYLNEPRYMVFYLLGNVALVCMLLGQPQPDRPGRGFAFAAKHVLLAALILLQVPLSRHTWDEARYLGGYYHTMAWQMLVLGKGRVPETCVPLLVACAMPASEREEAVEFLRKHQLNVYSPDFVRRYRLQALADAARQMPDAAGGQ